MRSTIARSESPAKRDARIARLINSARGPQTPAEIAECDQWLAERVAIVREAHQRYPVQTFAEADGEPADDESRRIVAKRLEYVQSRLGTDHWWNFKRTTASDRAKIVAMRTAGESFSAIAKRLKLKVDAVARAYYRTVAVARDAT
jgi:hypothetical protein